MNLSAKAEDFTLYVDADMPNFSRFEPGTRLARDSVAVDFVVGEMRLHVVFLMPTWRWGRGRRFWWPRFTLQVKPQNKLNSYLITTTWR